MLIDEQEKFNEGRGYRSFLLRLWSVDLDGKRAWRFSLENPVTGERRGFANLGELLVFLLDEVCDGQDDN